MEQKNNTLYREQRVHPFTITSNNIINDKRIGLTSLGLFVIMNAQADHWQFYETELVTRSEIDGLAKVRAALRRLEKYGYLRRKRRRNSLGQLQGIDWFISDEGKPEWAHEWARNNPNG